MTVSISFKTVGGATPCVACANTLSWGQHQHKQSLPQPILFHPNSSFLLHLLDLRNVPFNCQPTVSATGSDRFFVPGESGCISDLPQGLDPFPHLTSLSVLTLADSPSRSMAPNRALPLPDRI